MIYYAHQNIIQNDIDEVEKVLRSDFLTQGPALERFEKSVAEYCGAKYAVAVTNATSALHIACLAEGLQAGDVLWTSPITFVASANCGRYCGADVDFVDIDEKTYNLSPDELEKKLATATKIPKVVVAVHLAGQPCDMEKIDQLAKKYHFAVIEDASHALGATFEEKKVGACDFSDMTIFSFHPVKIITTGEGGMILTNKKDLYEKLCLLRSHGITRDKKFMQRDCSAPWYYEQLDLGFNYRMTDIQAALGYSQMQRLDDFLKRRRYLAKRYNELLKDLPVVLPYQDERTNSSWHLYIVRVDFSRMKKTKEDVFAEMRARGIALNLHYIPVHTQPYYGRNPEDFPKAMHYYEEAFTLPLYVNLTDEEQEKVVSDLREVLCEE